MDSQGSPWNAITFAVFSRFSSESPWFSPDCLGPVDCLDLSWASSWIPEDLIAWYNRGLQHLGLRTLTEHAVDFVWITSGLPGLTWILELPRIETPGMRLSESRYQNGSQVADSGMHVLIVFVFTLGSSELLVSSKHRPDQPFPDSRPRRCAAALPLQPNNRP